MITSERQLKKRRVFGRARRVCKGKSCSYSTSWSSITP